MFGSSRRRAWAGRPSDIPSERIRGPRAWFVTQSALGLAAGSRPSDRRRRAARSGVVAVEHPLSPAPAGGTIALADYELPTPIGPASLRMQYEGAGDRPRPNSFLLHAPGGDPLLEAAFTEQQVAAARRDVAPVGCCGGHAGVRDHVAAAGRSAARSPDRRADVAATTPATAAGRAALSSRARALIWAGAAARSSTAVPIVTSCCCCSAEPRRRARRAARRRRSSSSRAAMRARRPSARPRTRAALLSSSNCSPASASPPSWPGSRDAAAPVLDDSSVDLRHFSLHPWSEERLALLGGILVVPPRGALGRFAGPGRGRWPAGASVVFAARRHRLVALVGLDASGRWRLRRRGRAAAGPLPALGLVLSVTDVCAGRASLRAQVSAVVPPRDGRRPHPVAVRRLPAALAAPLSVGELLHRPQRAQSHRDALRA